MGNYINAIVIVQFSRNHFGDPNTGFEVRGSGFTSIKAERKDLKSAGKGGEEKIIAFLPIDHKDPGQHAFAAILDLAKVAEGSSIAEATIEPLLTEIFVAGVKHGRENPAD